MIAGDAFSGAYAVRVLRQTVSGAAATGQGTGNFTVSYRVGSTDIGPTFTVTEGSTIGPSGNQWREYLLTFASSSTVGRHTVSVLPDDTDLIANGELSTELEVYDADQLAGLLLTSRGVVVATTATTGSRTIYHGDTISINATVLESALTAIGASSLADCNTIAAEIKKTTTDSSSAAEVTTMTESIVSDTAGNRVVNALLASFPAALAVPTGQRSVAARMDLRLTKGTKTITAAAIDVTIVWKATS